MKVVSYEHLHRIALDLLGALTDAHDFKRVTDRLHEILCREIAYDWLSLYLIRKNGGDGIMHTSRGVPYAGNLCYGESAYDDTLLRMTSRCRHGAVILDNPPSSGADSFHADTGASFSARILAAEGTRKYAVLALYRNGGGKPFSRSEKAFLTGIATAMLPFAEILLLHYEQQLRQLTYPDGKQHYALLIDRRGRIISFPEETRALLEGYLSPLDRKSLLSTIRPCVSEVVSAATDRQKTAHWNMGLSFSGNTIPCQVQKVRDAFGHSLLRLQFNPPQRSGDFAALACKGLTHQQIEVLNFLPLGYTNPQIAMALRIKEITVKKHLQAIGAKLDARGKTEILYQALRLREGIE